MTVRAHPEVSRALLAILQSDGAGDGCLEPDRIRVEEDGGMRPDLFEVMAE